MRKIIITILAFFLLFGIAEAGWRFNPYTHKRDYHNYKRTAPSTSTTTCHKGEFAADANYYYICIDTNTWERVAISTWAMTDVLLLSDGTSKVLLSDGTSNILIRP